MFRNPTTDLIVVLAIVLLIWGPKRLPGLGKQLGHGLREFRDSVTGGHDDEPGEHDEPAQISQTSAAAPVAPAAESSAAEPAPSERRS